MDQKFWIDQWENFALGFSGGCAHIPTPKGKIRLLPGPGFGDGSHPSTLLILEMMEEFLPYDQVVDMGSGSGILSIAAKKMGAREVLGVEIDPEAISHALKNAELNQYDISFCLPTAVQIPSDSLVLINMISSQQKDLFPLFLSKAALIIASGLLIEEEEEYSSFLLSHGFMQKKRKERDGWISLAFIRAQ